MAWTFLPFVFWNQIKTKHHIAVIDPVHQKNVGLCYTTEKGKSLVGTQAIHPGTFWYYLDQL